MGKNNTPVGVKLFQYASRCSVTVKRKKADDVLYRIGNAYLVDYLFHLKVPEITRGLYLALPAIHVRT
jgi:hypothetical protein